MIPKYFNNIKIDTWWEIIDELRRELNIKEDAIVDLNECIKEYNNTFDDKYIAKINKLEQENKELKNSLKIKENELLEMSTLYDIQWKDVELKDQENKELKNNLELKDQELLEEWKENKKLRTKLNETISCKDYEGEAREYFHHNPQGNKVSFFMFDDDYINTYDIDESMEICTIYNDNI